MWFAMLAQRFLVCMCVCVCVCVCVFVNVCVCVCVLKELCKPCFQQDASHTEIAPPCVPHFSSHLKREAHSACSCLILPPTCKKGKCVCVLVCACVCVCARAHVRTCYTRVCRVHTERTPHFFRTEFPLVIVHRIARLLSEPQHLKQIPNTHKQRTSLTAPDWGCATCHCCAAA